MCDCSLAGATLQRTNSLTATKCVQESLHALSLRKQLDFAYAKTAPEMARWSNTPLPKCCVLARTYLYIGTFNEVGRVSDWLPYTISETKVYGNLAGN